MHTAVIQRLLWKETRTLWPVWGALLLATAALQAACVAYTWQNPHEKWFDGEVASWGNLVLLGMPLTFCVAAAAVAILFAGETEERTDDWLRLLPVSPKILASSKGAAALLFAKTL